MAEIIRRNLDEAFANACAYSEVVAAGDWVYVNFCVGNVGGSVEEQVHGALDNLEARLALVNLTLQSVVKVDVLMRDPWNIPAMEKVFAQRFQGVYPARKTIATEFAHKGGADGLQVQLDAIAYRGE
ncbi:MAG: RidA family protein [Clostridiales bacterium]|nr:RidA family protein [Clostridiales bacterium]